MEKTWDIVDFLAIDHGMDKKDADVFAMSVGEACKNAVVYSKGEQEGVYELVLTLNEDTIKAEIKNEGGPIELDKVEAFDRQQNFMKYENGGLGLPIIKKFMDEIKYKRVDNMNILSLIKHISSGRK